MSILQTIAANLQQLKQQRPLVHHLTNYVTVNDCANITLAIGASPVMADDAAEAAEMTAWAAALVLNIGTLNSRTIDSMLAAGQTARERNLPVIFDPVGVGATRLRTATAAQIIRQVRPSVIRGNMSEIKLIAGLDVGIKGVDSVADDTDGERVAIELAQSLDCIVAITGKTDIIASPHHLARIENGHKMLAQITGSGCMATSLVGCYCGAGNDWFIATAAGIMTMGIAGEIAEATLAAGESVGTFRVRLFDAIAGLEPELLIKRGRIDVSAV